MENMSRSELENFIITKEQELDNLRTSIANGEDVPFSKLVNLEEEIENAESELEKLAELERDDNSGSNLENARTREKVKEYEIDNEDELEANRIRDEQEKALEAQVAPLVASVITQENEEIPKSDFDKISRGLSYDLEHPYQEEEHEIEEEEPMPGMPRKIQ